MHEKTPSSIKTSLALVGVFVFINLITMILIVTNREHIMQSVVKLYDLQNSPVEKVNEITNYFVYGGAMVHIILCALGIWLGIKVANGREWARKRLTILLIISAVISFYMFTHLLAGKAEIAIHIINDIVKFSAIYFLWIPLESKSFFKDVRHG